MTFTSIPPSLRPVVEDVARAICVARKRDPETLHQLYFEEHPLDATDEKGRKYYRAWRLSVEPAEAAILAFLNACVERKIAERLGEVADDPDKFSIGPLWTLADDDMPSKALILNLGATDDTA